MLAILDLLGGRGCLSPEACRPAINCECIGVVGDCLVFFSFGHLRGVVIIPMRCHGEVGVQACRHPGFSLGLSVDRKRILKSQ